MSETPEKNLLEHDEGYKQSQNEVLFKTREAVMKEAGQVCNM